MEADDTISFFLSMYLLPANHWQILTPLTASLLQLLSLGVLGCGIWVLVDKPSFLDLFEQAEEQFPTEIGDGFDITLYTSAAYIIIVVAALVAIMSFFGCFGAWKESKCMLGTYFVLILVMFIVMVVGAVLAYTGKDL